MVLHSQHLHQASTVWSIKFKFVGIEEPERLRASFPGLKSLSELCVSLTLTSSPMWPGYKASFVYHSLYNLILGPDPFRSGVPCQMSWVRSGHETTAAKIYGYTPAPNMFQQ